MPFKQHGENRSGMGLGLTICQRSVEVSNGVLSVRDIPGSGCVFTIDLPRHMLPQQPRTPTVLMSGRPFDRGLG